mgnify:CR=1 FL=1
MKKNKKLESLEAVHTHTDSLSKNKGITLIALVITIIVLLLLVGITISSITGNNGLIRKAEQSKNETIKSKATETINLKITKIEIDSYAKNEKMPSLQYLADKLCEDEDMEYVLCESKKTGSLSKIDVSDDISSIFTKLKEYPYEFEINKSLQLASIDGIKISQDNNSIKYSSDLENWINTLEDKNISISDIVNNNLLQRLMDNKTSVDYMFSNSNIFDAVVDSKYAMEALGKSKYAGYVGILNENYRNKILGSKYIEYFDNGSTTIPTLYENNSNILYSSDQTTWKAFQAFDKKASTSWFTNNTMSEEFIGYNFGYKVIPYKVEIINTQYSNYYRCKDFSVKGSIDNVNYEDLTQTFTAEQNSNVQKFNITNIKNCQYIKIQIYNKYTTNNISSGLAEVQIYCRDIP